MLLFVVNDKKTWNLLFYSETRAFPPLPAALFSDPASGPILTWTIQRFIFLGSGKGNRDYGNGRPGLVPGKED